MTIHFLTLIFYTAISRRMATDQGGKRGPQSSRTQGDRYQRRDRGMDMNGGGMYGGGGDHDYSNPPNPGVPPAVPGFGFQLPGMPMFPPGFMLGGAQPGSAPPPPPPGQ
jgi:protein NRD1